MKQKLMITSIDTITNKTSLTKQRMKRVVILCGNKLGDAAMFKAAIRLGVGELILIGDNPLIKDFCYKHEIDVTFQPKGATVIASDNVNVLASQPMDKNNKFAVNALAQLELPGI